MEYLPAIATIAVIHFLAVASPGPDFIMVLRSSLVYSRMSGIYSALGLGLGILVHVAYSLAGIALIISQSVVLFNIIKLAGAGYLIYIGIKSLRAKPSKDITSSSADHAQEDISKWHAVRIGFITNATNPKATLFFLSLFTLVIQPSTPFAIKMIMGLEMAVATFVWFAFVATLVSHRSIRRRVTRLQHYIERTMGAALILFGIKLATIQSK